MIPSRLDKYLSDATALSRSQVRRIHESGDITVRYEGASDAVTPDDLSVLIFREDEVFVRGERVEPISANIYLALNKPSGVLSDTSPSDTHERTLHEWLKDLPDGVFPVGRLDQDTFGFMLLTDDGNLAHVVSQPSTHLLYTYRLRFDEELDAADVRLKELIAGVELRPGESTSLEALRIVRSADGVTELEASIFDSRSKELHSMSNVLHLPVLWVCRTGIGPVAMGDVEPGEVRALSDEEVESLWDACGGKARVDARRIDALVRQLRRMKEAGEEHERLERWLSSRGHWPPAVAPP